MRKMTYRLALDLGSTSLGWAMVRLNANNEPCAIIKAGVRIFSDGRNPKDGSSLAASRREARAMQTTGCRTVGEWLFARHQQGLSVRARYRENRI
jgi:CRISPR/Cas system Type II protein with McrA/HNH and RuvC-like nuclease domain